MLFILLVALFATFRCCVADSCSGDGVITCDPDAKFPLPLEEDSDNVTHLILTGTHIESINEKDLASFKNLVSIDLSNSGIKYIDKNAFADNMKLEVLNLANCSDLIFDEEQHSIISNSLATLNLSNTMVKEIHDKMFSQLPNLQILDLSDTHFETPQLLSSLTQLKHLIISQINDSYINILCNGTKLEKITVNDKDISCTEYHHTESNGTSLIEKSEEPESTSTIEVYQSTEQNDNKKVEPDMTHESTTSDAKEIQPDKEENNTEATETESEDKHDKKSEENQEQPIENQDENTSKEISKNQTVVENQDENTSEEISQNQTVVGKSTDTGLQKNIIVKVNERAKTVELLNLQEPEDRAAVDKNTPPTTSSISSTNVVLGIILGVLIVGALGFGYKYWKNYSGYRNTHTDDNQENGKELQVITVHNQPEEEQKLTNN